MKASDKGVFFLYVLTFASLGVTQGQGLVKRNKLCITNKNCYYRQSITCIEC